MSADNRQYIKTFPVSWDSESQFVDPIVGQK